MTRRRVEPDLSLSSAIPVDGPISISTNYKKDWVNARCNWRWAGVRLSRPGSPRRR